MIKFKNNSEPDITDENLNKMQQDIGTVVSATEPQGNERLKVWLQKGKNLFNKKNAVSGWITSDGSTGSSTATNRTGKIRIKANATYIFSYDYTSLASQDARSYCIYDNDFNVVSSSNLTYDITTKQHTFSSTKDGYIDIGYDVNCTNIMFEQNSEKTLYEAYIEPKIYVLNNNGVYEEFVEENKGVEYKTIASGSFDNLMGNNSNYPERYYIQSTTLVNTPVDAYGWLTSYYQSTNTQVQVFIANNGNIYTRRKLGGVWQTWSNLLN